MWKCPGGEELSEKKGPRGEAMTAETERVRVDMVGDEARNA